MTLSMKSLRIDPDKCTGCKQCELACSWVQTGTFQPSKSVIRVHIFDEQASFAPYACFQCEEAWCMHACPVNAIDLDEKTGSVVVIDEVCVGNDDITDAQDKIITFRIGTRSLTEIGEAEEPSGFALATIAVDPVEGKFAYLGLNDGDNVDIYDISGGGTLTRRAVNPLAGNAALRNCRGIAIQP